MNFKLMVLFAFSICSMMVWTSKPNYPDNYLKRIFYQEYLFQLQTMPPEMRLLDFLCLIIGENFFAPTDTYVSTLLKDIRAMCFCNVVKRQQITTELNLYLLTISQDPQLLDTEIGQWCLTQLKYYADCCHTKLTPQEKLAAAQGLIKYIRDALIVLYHQTTEHESELTVQAFLAPA